MQALPYGAGAGLNLVYRVTERQRLIVVEHAVQKMQGFAQHRCWDREAGGVLLGRHLLDSHDVVVDDVTTPQDSDRRSRYSFFRSAKHEHIARQRWIDQGSTSAYLGLWHTHPEADPTPSSVDRSDWIRAVARDTFEGDRLFFPIMGTQNIRIWTLSRRGMFRELKLQTNKDHEQDDSLD